MKIEKRSEGQALRLWKKFHKDEEKAKEVGGEAVEPVRGILEAQVTAVSDSALQSH